MKYLRDTLCGPVLSDSEYKTLSHRAGDDWNSLENLAAILLERDLPDADTFV